MACTCPIYIRARANRRQRELINAFPDALDLMLVCVEAGLGLEAAFSRVGMEMTTSHPRLAEQFGAVVLELRAGRSHEDALRRMADRAGADDIRAFATLLIQSTKLGSSIAQTLRTYASEMREKRRMRAEEKAHRLPVLFRYRSSHACCLHDRGLDVASGHPRGTRHPAGFERRRLKNVQGKAAFAEC